ncbi:hypothetical protein K7711_15830 [Nocardia sp. CA2R105]|nr:hypothetical protein [Nocardia coffeae]MBY8857955.1 hypothetical protein [Nocardia coffeae]
MAAALNVLSTEDIIGYPGSGAEQGERLESVNCTGFSSSRISMSSRDS